MSKKDVKRGLRYEKSKAKKHGAKHVGGPGKPDYQRGKITGEVKDRKTKVTKPELQNILKKGITEVDSKSGFTQPALDYAKRYRPNVKLMKKGKQIK